MTFDQHTQVGMIVEKVGVINNRALLVSPDHILMQIKKHILPATFGREHVIG